MRANALSRSALVAGDSFGMVVLSGSSWLFLLPVIEAEPTYLAEGDGECFLLMIQSQY